MIVKTKCPACDSTKDFELDDEAYLVWQRGALIQRAFPWLDPDDRERLITGICPECWKRLTADGQNWTDDGPGEL